MKKKSLIRWVLFASLAMACTSVLMAGDWGDDFGRAKKEAARKELPILINFSGSDWCGWCIRLEKEVFDKKEFKKYASDNLVLFVADFPRRKAPSKKVAKQNQELSEQYGVRGFPTILLVDAEGKEIARTGYKPGGPEAYVTHLKELLAAPKAEPAK